MAKKHLYEIDLMRAFIMLGVLSVHTVTAYMAQLDNTSFAFLTIAAVHTSMHFTRESFMFITGLVLFVTYYRKSFNSLKFWWKRLTLVGIPFIAWDILDSLWQEHNRAHPIWSFSVLFHKVIHVLMYGDDFHLYYILVSIQLYIVFPILLYALRKFERWHLQIFIGSFVFQLTLMAFYEFVLPQLQKGHWPNAFVTLAQNHGTFILTYQFWFVAGGIFACHYQKVLEFVSRHRKALFVTLALGVVVMWGQYLTNRFVLHQSAAQAEAVEQPLMVPYALVVTAAIWYLGVLWARRRELAQYRVVSAFIRIAANASFGIYLLQIYPLHFVQLAARMMNVPAWLYFCSIPFAIAFVYLSSMVVAHFIGRTPVISYVVGRKVAFMRAAKSKQLSMSS